MAGSENLERYWKRPGRESKRWSVREKEKREREREGGEVEREKEGERGIKREGGGQGRAGAETDRE